MKKKLIIGLVICFLLALIAYLIKGSPVEVEVSKAEKGSVFEFISEDGKTRLADIYTISMPVDGRLLRMDLEVGDYVQEDQVVARMDSYQVRQKLAGLKARLEEISAQIVGVDEAKPKSEDIEAGRLRMEASRLNLESSSKELEIAQINYERQKRDYERLEELWKDRAISQSAYDAAEQLYKSAQERLEQARIQKAAATRELELNETNYRRILNSVDDNEYLRKAYQAQKQQIRSEINILEDHLSKTRIMSPVNGPVIEKFIEDEQVLLAGTPILVLGDLSSIEIEADILSEEIGRVRVGQGVEISGKAVGEEIIPGRVKTIYPSGFKKISSLGIEQQRVKTLISFDNSELNLRPGLSVDVKIIVAESHGTLVIPEKAVFKHSNGWAVFVLEGNRIKIQGIRIGLKNTDSLEVKEGLSEGQVFVLSPQNELKHGMKIKPVFR